MDGDTEGNLQDLARAELGRLLTSPDPAVRARVALALRKEAGEQDGATPYDGLSPAALLDHLLALSAPPLRTQWDAERQRAFLVGHVPRLSRGNTLDQDGRLEEGAAD